MSELVKLDIQDGVAQVTLQNGKVNAVSHEVLDQLNAAFDEAEAQKAIVVLTGQPGILSGGYDLKTMRESLEAAIGLVTKGSQFSRRMIAFPRPVVTACTGHAVAQGSFFLLCSDYRVGIEGDFKLGLNEVAIGIAMHHAGIAMAQYRMSPAFFNRSVITAEMFDPETAIDAGILDRVVAPDALQATTQAVVEHMKTLDARAHYETKLKARAPFIEAMDRAIELDKNGTL